VPVVRTVDGDIDPRELGFTHCHEHLFVFPTSGVELADKLIIDDYEKTRAELERFRAAGGRSLVDAQPFGAGRDPELLARAARETGLHLVASTGLHRRFYYPRDAWMYRASQEELAGLFVSEIEEGMYAYDPAEPFARRTGVRAGVIKVGMDADGLSPHYRKVFGAAAEAHRQNGAPIMTHAELSRWGREQAEFLLGRGVDAGSIIISHMDRVVDLERNLELARLGVFLEYDTIARYRYHSDEEELDLIEGMVEAGFAGNILLGMDVTRERMPSYGGSFGLAYLAGAFLPRLVERGMGRETVETIMIANPRRALVLRNRSGA
jgi:predicted metal-dependent phosphotriesterase family hydrolase